MVGVVSWARAGSGTPAEWAERLPAVNARVRAATVREMRPPVVRDQRGPQWSVSQPVRRAPRGWCP